MNLHIKSKLVSIHHKMDILDDDDQPVYHVSGKPISLHDKTHITDLDGNEIASIHAKAVSIHHKYFVDMADGASFELSEQLFHIKDIIDIPELGWQLRGSILAFEFQIVDAQERVLATAHRHIVSLHGVYDIKILDESQIEKLLAVFVVINHIIVNRETAEASSSAPPSANV